MVVGAVLRFWDLGQGTLTADETFSAVAAHLPFGQIWGHIAATDRHPPLSYFVLSPVAHVTTSTFALRAPAAICATLALVVFAWWQSRYGVAGLIATALFALSPFLLNYGRVARMFALVALGAVVLVAASDRWLATGDRRWAAIGAAGGLVVAMSYSVGVLMPGFMILVPGLRRDREAWMFRLAGLAAVGVWSVLWMGNTLRWSGAPSGYPALTPNWLATALNYMIAPVPQDQWVVLLLMALGLVVVLRGPGRERQLTITLFVLPVIAMVILSAHNELFIPKTLLMLAWAPPVLLSRLTVAAWRIRPLAGAAVLAAVILVVLPYVAASLPVDEGAGAMLAAVQRARRPGDAMAMNPAPLGDLLEWYEGVVPGRTLTQDERTIKGAVILRVEGEASTGRIWLVQSIGRAARTSLGRYTRSCGPSVVVGGGYSMRCVELGRSG